MKPEQLIFNLLRGSGATVCTAESCTGGRIAHLLTTIPGSSEYVLGGIVSYAVEIKERILGIAPQIIEQYGVVSSKVAEEMAESVKKLMGATYSVSTTGLAGPGGDNDNPEGTLWIGVSGPKGTISKKVNVNLGRESNIKQFSVLALETLYEYILSSENTVNHYY